MAPNPLEPAAVLDAMANALPTHQKDDTTSDLSSSLDAIALATHAVLTNLGFRLLGFKEGQNIGKSRSCALLPRMCSLLTLSPKKPSVPGLRPVYHHNGTVPLLPTASFTRTHSLRCNLSSKSTD